MILPLHKSDKDPFRNDGKRWTYDQYDKLMGLYEKGLRWGQIAQEMGRTVPACVRKLRDLRMYGSMPKKLWRPRPLYKLPHLEHKGRK